MHKKHVELNRLRAEIKTENRRLNLEKVSLLCDVEDKINEMLIPVVYLGSTFTTLQL